MIKRLLFLQLLACGVALPPAASAEWEKIRQSDAPLAVVNVVTGSYELSYTVGDNCASAAELVGAPGSVWSGYLSLVPAEIVSRGLAAAASTSSVQADGALWGMTPGENLDLNFNDEISAALSDPAVNVTQLYDNTGGVSNSSWPVTLSYSGQKLVIIPSDAWPKGSVFSVYFSSAIVDINGSPVTPAATVYFSVIMDYAADNTVAAFSDRRVRVSIPANAYAQDFFVTLSTDAGGAAVTGANSRLPSLPGSPEFVNTVSVTPYDASGNTIQPNSACVVTLPYPDADGDGLVDGALSRLKVSSLSVWHLDEPRGLWVRQAGSAIDTTAKTVSQPVSHFSNYALLAVPDADLSPVYAYPVPFRPNAGDAARYGSWADLITFTNLPAAGKLRIYTVSGALVRELAVAPPSMKWDLKNTDGETVASGVYLWELTSGKSRKTGKLVVVK